MGGRDTRIVVGGTSIVIGVLGDTMIVVGGTRI